MLSGAQVKHTQGRFFLVMQDREAILQYRLISSGKDVRMDMHDIFVPTELRGRGVAEHLTRDAFRWAEKKGIKVIPTCPYIRDKFLKENPEFKRLAVEKGI